MRTLLVVVILAGASAGCFVSERSSSRHQTVVHEKRGCGPAHHWDAHANACIHNGKAKGHYK